MAEMAYIRVCVDYLDAIELLGDAEKGRLFTALLTYARTGEVPQLGGNERFIFPMIRAQIDRDRVAADDLSEARSRAGKKGAEAKQANARFAKRTEAKQANARFAKRTEANLANAEFAKQTEANLANAEFAEQAEAISPPPAPPSAPLSSPRPLSPGPPISHPPIIPPVSPNTPSSAPTAKARMTPPTLDEVRAYACERGKPELAQAFFDYFEAGKWVDAKGQPVRSWKQKFLTWEKFDKQGQGPYRQTARIDRPPGLSMSDKMEVLRKLHDEFRDEEVGTG